MAEQTFFMDVDGVLDEISFWTEMIDTLTTTYDTIQATSYSLIGANLITFGTTESIRQALDQINTVVKKVTDVIEVLADLLNRAVEAFQNGDDFGATLFH